MRMQEERIHGKREVFSWEKNHVHFVKVQI